MSDDRFTDINESEAIEALRQQLLMGYKSNAARLNTAWMAAHGVDLIRRIESESVRGAQDREGDEQPAAMASSVESVRGLSLTNGSIEYTMTVGVIFGLIGVGMIVAGFLMDASVPVDNALGALGSIERVNNTGILNDKLMLVVAGSAFLVSGSVFMARTKPLLAK